VFNRNQLLSTVFVGGVFVSSLAYAHTISEFEVVGNRRVETPTILSYVTLAKGDRFEEEQREEVLKNLFSSGLFSDVVVTQEGGVVRIEVSENQVLNEIAFEGNDRIKDAMLKTELGLRPREIYTPARAQEAAQKIRDMYRAMGRYAARVEPKVVEREGNRVDLVFEIDEGHATKVNRINFVGNKRFTERRLETVIMTKEARWYRFFTTDDSYDPHRMAYDQELLRKYYLNNGYLDFRVLSAVAELDSDSHDFTMTYTIEEGERYKISKVELDNHLQQLNPEGLASVLSFESGDWYSQQDVEKSIEKLTDAIMERGISFVQIEPALEKNVEAQTVELKLVITEGPKVFVNRINILGNDRTNDEVVRREFRFVEGDPKNQSKMKRTKQRLKALGYFRKVELTEAPAGSPDKVDINAEVEDQPTGSMQFSGGYSTSDGAMGAISLQESNVMGKGYIFNMSAMVAQRAQDFRAGIADPYFLGRRLLVGLEGFHTQRKYSTRKAMHGGYRHMSTGGTVHAGYELTEALTQSWSYTLREDKIDDVRRRASRFLRQQLGDWLVSSVSHNLFYDKRDDALDPTEGYYLALGNQFAGLGGDVRYLKNGASAGMYMPIDDSRELVWSNKITGGFITQLDKKIRIVDRHQLGGETLRGFDEAGVGPRDLSTGDALGGRYFYKGTSEISFPLGLPNEMGVKGSVFVDVGSVWHSGDRSTAASPIGGDSSSPRVASGVGVNWRSPFGPIGISFAKAIVKKKGVDRTRTFRVNFGTSF